MSLRSEGGARFFMLSDPAATKEIVETLPERVNLLGIGVSVVDMGIVIEMIERWVYAGQERYVCVATVNSLVESQNDESWRRLHNAAGLVTPDGMPLVWFSRVMGFQQISRVCGPDLMLRMCERSEKNAFRHFFYGGRPELLQSLKSPSCDDIPD